MSNIIVTPFLQYLRIAAEAQEKMVHYVQVTGTTSAATDNFHDTADGQATIVVVFTAIALECYIHNYSTRKLGENFSKKHIESMSHHTKWLLVPKLATGKGIPTDHEAIALLRDLIAARNRVVHAKAVNVSPNDWDQQLKRIKSNNRSVVDAALAAFRCVGELGSALSASDPDEPSAKLLSQFLQLPKPSLRFESDPTEEETQSSP